MADTKRGNPHRHVWRFHGYTGPWERLTLGERCRCAAERDRPATRREARLLKRRNDASMGMFTVLHAFQRRFQNKDGAWKYSGYDLMQRIERWAKQRPDRVHLASTDDVHHMNSFLCIIECATEHKWMGLTVINVPQCVVEPEEFFLYPNDCRNLSELLRELQRKGARVMRRHRADERRFWRTFRAARPKQRA